MRTDGRRRMAAVVAGACAVALSGAGMAWACTGQVLMELGPVVAGPPGEKVAATVLTGPGFYGGPAEVRWNGSDGPVLASTVIPEGSQTPIEVTVPDVRPGVYYLVLRAGDEGVARAAFEVTTPGLSTDSLRQAGAWQASPDPVADRNGSASAVTAGVVLLTVGLVGLSAFGLLLGRRRRVAVPVEGS